MLQMETFVRVCQYMNPITPSKPNHSTERTTQSCRKPSHTWTTDSLHADLFSLFPNPAEGKSTKIVDEHFFNCR